MTSCTSEPAPPSPLLAGRLLSVGVALVAVAAPGLARADAPPLLRVAIDPGHGGSNLGAAAAVEGVHEKRFTLALARLLRKRLERAGITVVTTRDTDAYVTLAERVRRANAASADLFLSLHANASPDHRRRGFETFVSTREVADIEAARAAAAAPDPVDAMIARARVRHLAQRSARLAQALRAHLGQVRETDRSTRQAAFDVLEGLQMPAALVEVGFIDHPDEGPDLLRAQTMRRIVEAIAEAIESFAGPA